MIPYLFVGGGVILGAYLFAINPKSGNQPDFSKFDRPFYAHRGLFDNESQEHPENSKQAFLRAIEKNYGIELDVQVTKDGVPVVFHDATLKRACCVDLKVSELTFEELKEYKLFDSRESIPTFQEVMDLIHGQVPVIVEIKMYEDDSKVNEHAMEVLDSYQGVYCMESFHPKSLLWFKKNRPTVLRGQLSANFIRGKEPGNKLRYFAWQNLLWNFLTKPDFIAYNYLEKSMLSVRICRKLYQETMFAWTIRSKEGYQEAKGDFDYFIFDQVDPMTLSE